MSQDYTVSRLGGVLGGIEELTTEIQNERKILESSIAQLSESAAIVADFIDQTFRAVQIAETEADIKNQLISSLNEIKRFMQTQPSTIQGRINACEQKVEAYSTCRALINDAAIDIEQNIATEKRIREKIENEDESGRRKSGERPEKLRDIRRVEAQIDEENSAEENI
tara:strand:+ start:394 stop:897 length:504 start_codon:yes stop_codon:yes gene_type:complete